MNVDLRSYSFDIVDSYVGLEAINPIVKSGTEELGFFSETGTYNMDNIPCIEFTIDNETSNMANALICELRNNILW